MHVYGNYFMYIFTIQRKCNVKKYILTLFNILNVLLPWRMLKVQEIQNVQVA